jgi:pyruvate kinase
MPNHARIIATLGPASRNIFPRLREAGADAFRINASHMSADEAAELAASVRRQFPDCPIIVDLQGAKMRLGHFQPRPVNKNDRIRFGLAGCADALLLPHPELFASVRIGDTLSFDDDRIRFRVDAAAPHEIEAVALSEGILRPRKGANLLEHPVDISDLTEMDAEVVRRTSSLGGLGYAFSFMKDGRENTWIRRRAPASPVIGKIERREATANAGNIERAVDEVWVCRGDLGAQLGLSRMARWVAGYDPKSAACPVLMAGQVLEHLTAHQDPTRAEVCHLFDLVQRGYAGFVLSDETAIGKDPARAVNTLSTLLSAF